MNKLEIVLDYDAGKNKLGQSLFILTVKDEKGVIQTRKTRGLFNLRRATDSMIDRYAVGVVDDRGFEYFVNVD